MKKKLNLNELSVKSFITNVNNDQIETVKAGAAPNNGGDAVRPKSLNAGCQHISDMGDCAPSGGESVLNVCKTVYYDC